MNPRVADQWGQATGMQRLQNLDMDRCPLFPDDMQRDPYSFESFMHSMHRALNGLHDEDLMDLEEKYNKKYHHIVAVRPNWMTLEPPADFRIWAEILNEQKFDAGAIDDFREVIDSGGYGYYEGIRIIAHLLKDNAKPA